MKKTLLSLVCLASLLYAEKITIGATPVPHAEILEFIKPELAKKGYELDIKVFNDYILPNIALDEKDLDANFMQHEPYMREFNAKSGTKIESAFGVHLEPMGAYSKKIKKLDELKNDDKIAIPNDPTNLSRALELLSKHGVIELDPNSKLKTELDITKNPKNLQVIALEAATLPRVLEDVALAVINSNFAMNADLNPLKDALIIEDGQNNPYTNIVCLRSDETTSKKAQVLKDAILTEAVKKFILEKYKGAVVPSF